MVKLKSTRRTSRERVRQVTEQMILRQREEVWRRLRRQADKKGRDYGNPAEYKFRRDFKESMSIEVTVRSNFNMKRFVRSLK